MRWQLLLANCHRQNGLFFQYYTKVVLLFALCPLSTKPSRDTVSVKLTACIQYNVRRLNVFCTVMFCSGVNNRVHVYKHCCTADDEQWYCFDLALVYIMCLVFDSCCKQKPMYNNKNTITITVEICGSLHLLICHGSFQLHCLQYVFVNLRSTEMFSCYL